MSYEPMPYAPTPMPSTPMAMPHAPMPYALGRRYMWNENSWSNELSVVDPILTPVLCS